MANKLLKTRMQQKIDTSQNWAKATNFVPLKGEICIYSDLHRMKVGDGTSKIGDLDFENPVDAELSTTSENPVQNKAVKAELDAKISKSGGTFTGELTYIGTNEFAINLGGEGSIWSAKSFQFSSLTDKINITPLSDTIGLKLLSSDNTDVIVSGIATPTSDNHAVNKQYVDNKVPNTTTSDNNKFLRIVNGTPTWVALTNVAEEGA